jgi:uncharacterized protein (TIGR02186 family)
MASAFLVIMAAGYFLAPGAAAQDCPSINISPPKIDIDSFYHGTTITCQGTVPRDSRVAIILRSTGKEHQLSRKDRVGPLWMNVETVTVSGAPQMYYLVTSTKAIGELSCEETLGKCCIGYGSMRKSVGIKQNGSNGEEIFSEFIKLEESLGHYKTLPDSIALTPVDDKVARFEASIPIPPSAPPDEYEICVYSFTGEAGNASASCKLVVAKAGLPQMLSALALNHAALYGILSIVVAIAAGLAMGIVFRSKAKGGH